MKELSKTVEEVLDKVRDADDLFGLMDDNEFLKKAVISGLVISDTGKILSIILGNLTGLDLSEKDSLQDYLLKNLEVSQDDLYSLMEEAPEVNKENIQEVKLEKSPIGINYSNKSSLEFSMAALKLIVSGLKANAKNVTDRDIFSIVTDIYKSDLTKDNFDEFSREVLEGV